MTRALKALSAVAILAALFLPLATCRDAHGVRTAMSLADGSAGGVPSAAFFVWPVVFVAIELLAPWPRFVRVLIAIEPILAVVAAAVLWSALACAALMSFGGEVEVGAGAYLAEVGLTGYFCASAVENFALLRRRKAHAI